MAYLPDEQNPQNQQNSSGGASGQSAMASQAPITSSPAPTSGGVGGKTIAQPSSQGSAQPFTNLQAYLTANAPQIQAQGDQIAGQLGTQYGQTTGAIDAGTSAFGNQVKAGYTPNDQQVVNNFNSDPTAVANDANAANTFKGMYNDKYTGPGSFETSDQYGGLVDKVQKAQSAANQVSTPGGLQTYLMGQNPNETQGMATLDSSLLGANPDVQAKVTAAAQPFNGLTDKLTNATNTSDAGVAQAIQEAQAAKAAAQSAFGTQATGLNNQINSEYQKSIGDAKQFNTNYNDIISKLGSATHPGQLTPNEEAGLQLNNSVLGNYAGANSVLDNYNNAGDLTKYALTANSLGNGDVTPLSNYLTGGHTATLPNDINSVASQQEFQRAAALSALGGQNYTSPLDQSKASLGGTYTSDGKYQTFDTSKANGLFDEVKQRDKALVDGGNGIKSVMNSPIPGTSNNSLYNPGDYQTALTDANKAVAGGAQPNADIYAALDRLANGYGPGNTAFTPTVLPPSIGGGVIDPSTGLPYYTNNPNPNGASGGGHAFR